MSLNRPMIASPGSDDCEPLQLFLALPLSALALSPPWFFIRPQLVSHPFIPLFVNTCERFRRKGDLRCLWYLPILSAVWANMHPLWLVGLVIVAAYAVGPLAGRQNRLTCPRWALLVVLAACSAAVLINPYGAGLVAYEWYFQTQRNFQAVNELRPLFDNPSPFFYPFLIYLALCWLALLSRIRSIPLPGIVLSVAGTASALAANKFAPIAVLLTWPYFGFALAGLRPYLLAARDGRLFLAMPIQIAPARLKLSPLRYLFGSHLPITFNPPVLLTLVFGVDILYYIEFSRQHRGTRYEARLLKLL